MDANAFDPGTQLAFSSNGDGTLTVVHEDSPEKFTSVASVTTQRGARTMALDLKTHRIFLVTAEFGPPPAPTAEHPHPRPAAIPGSFTLLVFGQKLYAAFRERGQRLSTIRRARHVALRTQEFVR